MSLSIRTYCYDSRRKLLAVPHKLAMALHQGTIPIAQFANSTVKLAELVVSLESRKPVAVVRETYYLLRFRLDGMPDTERLNRQMVAALNLTCPSAQHDGLTKVANHEDEFVHRGGRWTPTIAEKAEIRATALGKNRVSRLKAQE